MLDAEGYATEQKREAAVLSIMRGLANGMGGECQTSDMRLPDVNLNDAASRESYRRDPLAWMRAGDDRTALVALLGGPDYAVKVLAPHLVELPAEKASMTPVTPPPKAASVTPVTAPPTA